MTVNSITPGIYLERFDRKNANMVLSWRNAPHVRANSLNDAEIALDDHIAFVDGLASRSDRHFFILHINGHPEAVFNINLDGTQGLWGCYIGGQTEPRPGLFPMLVGISGRLAFGTLGCTTLKSEVLSANKPPQKLNSFIGVNSNGTRVEKRPSGEKVEVLLYRVELAEWNDVRDQIDKVLTCGQRLMLSRFDTNPEASMM